MIIKVFPGLYTLVVDLQKSNFGMNITWREKSVISIYQMEKYNLDTYAPAKIKINKYRLEFLKMFPSNMREWDVAPW